jgi:2-polyprenyl-6-methoxyphenol hydroxylase-like FAD-dependent oxidoreductase
MTNYDVIVVGARVAGSPTAMMLARKGYRVLLVDRATFPSDTMSTHHIHAPGMAALRRWGLAERLIATGCPPVPTYRFDFGPFALAGRPRGVPGAPHAYAPRRIVLDNLLVEAAVEAGAEIREGFSVEDLIVEDGAVRGIRGHTQDGPSVVERARVVVGADGVNSVVAKSVQAPKYNEVPAAEALYYSYWSDMPTDGELQFFLRDTRALAALPTHDGLTCVLVAWPIEEFETNKRDVEGNYLRAFQSDDVFADRIARATRQSRIVGTHMHNFYRRPCGPGWALVGDAGYHKDACTAQGITDAFLHAELLAERLNEALSGARPYDEALASYHETRDAATAAIFELTCQFASFEPLPPEMEELLGALYESEQGTEDFLSAFAGTMSVQDFFDPSNIARYMAGADAPTSST